MLLMNIKYFWDWILWEENERKYKSSSICFFGENPKHFDFLPHSRVCRDHETIEVSEKQKLSSLTFRGKFICENNGKRTKVKLSEAKISNFHWQISVVSEQFKLFPISIVLTCEYRQISQRQSQFYLTLEINENRKKFDTEKSRKTQN